MIYTSKSEALHNFNAMTESVSSECDEDSVTKKNKSGLTPLSVSDYASTELGMDRDEELAEDPVYGNFFRDPIIMETLSNYFDLTDGKTRKAILAMNEAEQTTMLNTLTSKLYDNIVSKVDDIDFGEIPMTKGDITKLSNYNKMEECITLLRDILKEYKQDPAPINEISLAISNIRSHKDMFNRAFKLNVELPIITYNLVTLSVINAVSFMIASCIEFIKTPNKDSFTIVLDKVAYAKTKSNMVYNSMKSFNKSCAKGDFDKAMNHVIDTYVKNEGAVLGAIGVAAAIGKGIFATTKVIGIIIGIIGFLRWLVFFFYYACMRFSEFLEVQSDLLEINAKNIENDASMDETQKKRVVSSQMKIVEFFRKLSNKLSINTKKAEVESTKEMDKEDKEKSKIDPDASSLF